MTTFSPEQIAQITALIVAATTPQALLREPSPQQPPYQQQLLPHQPQQQPPLQQPPHTQSQQRQPPQPSLGQTYDERSLAPSVAQTAVTMMPTNARALEILAHAEARAATERELVKRLCLLLRPTEENVWPLLLRLVVVFPHEISSSPNLRARLIAASRRLSNEHPALYALLVATAPNLPITPQDLGAGNPVAADACILGAVLFARAFGPWAIMGRVDQRRVAHHNDTRFERVDVTTALEALAEDWLLTEKPPQKQQQKRPRDEPGPLLKNPKQM